MPYAPNLRTLKISTSTGKDVKSTSQLKELSKPTGKMNESNNTNEYSVAAPPKSDLGGMNTRK